MNIFELVIIVPVLSVIFSLFILWFFVLTRGITYRFFKDLYIKKNTPQEFIDNVLSLCIYVMNLDENIDDVELDYVKKTFDKNFGKGIGKKAIKVLMQKQKTDYEGTDKTANIEHICEELNKTMNLRTKRLLFLYLMNLAKQSKNNLKAEKGGLLKVSKYLELVHEDIVLIKYWLNKPYLRIRGGKPTIPVPDDSEILNKIKNDLSPVELEDQFDRMYVKYRLDMGLTKNNEIKKSLQEHLLRINQAYHDIKEGQLDVTEELSRELNKIGLEVGIYQMKQMEKKLIIVLKMMINKSINNPMLIDKYEQNLYDTYVYLLKNLRNLVIEKSKNENSRVDTLLEENEQGINNVDALLLELKDIGSLNEQTENKMEHALKELELWKEKVKLYDIA